jgi:hypothetical protein
MNFCCLCVDVLLHTAVHGYKSERAAVPKNLFVNPDAVWNNATKYFKTGAPAIVGYVPVYPVYPVPSHTCDGVGRRGVHGWMGGVGIPAHASLFCPPSL